MSRRNWINQAIAAGLAVAIVVPLAACSNAVNRREADELENIWRSNVIPKTTPKRFVSAFEDVCLAHIQNPDQTAAKLRADDYVEMTGQAGFRTFVVDTKLPLISFKTAPDRLHCYASAEARTGQSARVNDLVASLPNARPVGPAVTKLPAEQAWLIGPGNSTLIYTMRNGSTFDHPRYVVGVIHL